MVYLDYASTCPEIKRKNKWMLNANQQYAKNESVALQNFENTIRNKLNLHDGKFLFCHDVSTLLEQLNYRMRFLRYTNLASCFEHESIVNVSHSTFNNESDLCVQLDKLEEKSWYDKIFVYQMLTNNITGRIYDVEAIGNICKEYGAFCCCDLTAAIGHNKIPEDISSCCDMVFASGHKFGANPGIGFVWLSNALSKCLYEFSLGGTKDLNGIEQLTNALSRSVDNLNELHFDDLSRFLQKQLYKNSLTSYVVDSQHEKTKAINSILLFDISADSLQSYLASKKIYVSVGHSACADDKDYRVLAACNIPLEYASNVIRVSFSNTTTKRDIKKLVKHIRKYKSLYTG